MWKNAEKGEEERKSVQMRINSVDNWGVGWYSMKAVWQNRSDANEKILKKDKKVVDKWSLICYHSNVPPKWRVPCKLNNVTKRKHQTETAFMSCNQEVAKYAVKSITRKGNYKKWSYDK